MGALSRIRKAGFSVSLTGDSIEIIPASALTPNQREFLKHHKAEIIDELRSEAFTLSATDRQKLLDYFAAIGETDQADFDELLIECAKDPIKKAFMLGWANDCLQINRGEMAGFVQCSNCLHLNGETCSQYRYKFVTSKPRRCAEYQP